MTLITGDRVRLWTIGGHTRVAVEPARQPGVVQFHQFTWQGDQYVVPSDAARLVQERLLDLQLFNVTGLVRQGYDDAHLTTTPLLLQYNDSYLTARAPAPAGTKVRRDLPHLRMAALDQEKSAAAQVWDLAITTTTTGDAAAQGRTDVRRLVGGIQRVWLNGKAHASLDQSVPQIGAPAAWSRGLTGAGVMVAVLDTGVDTGHRDLAGRIGPAKDFSGKGGVADGHGHGTHVASTVAGSGAASAGRYKGVAPDATLAIGKVLDDTGSGTFDSIIAGMQWAAAESGAKVVNMSLGGYPSDGTDPMSAAVNALTAEFGTLFVAAAGNSGADETVSTPAAADAALAVGSTGRDEVPSAFSSRGPRLSDGVVKPDLAAPGENIAAARPAGVEPLGDPVGDAYQRMSGTSMAAPHVAGSAALLRQQHPDWTAGQVKAALMSTAAEVTGAGPYAVGTGRVDVARATGQAVTATGSVSTFLPWPNLGMSKRQTVTWHNGGPTAVTLGLSAALAGAPPGLLTLSADSVTVPSGGDASVEVTVAAQATAAGKFGGILIARGADGSVHTRTALSVYQEEERYDLTVNLVDRAGNPAPAGSHSTWTILDLDRVLNGKFFLVSGETVRLPRGRYAIHATIATARAGQEPTLSVISHPELKLDRDRVETVDARVGMPASISVDDPAARGGIHDISTFSRISDCACTYLISTTVDPRFFHVYAGTVPGTRSPGFAFAQARRAEEPVLELFAQTAQPFEVPVSWWTDPPAGEQATVAAVYGGSGTPEDLAKIDARGKLVLLEIPEGAGRDQVDRAIAAVEQAGGRLAMLIPLSPAPGAADGGGEETDAALPVMFGNGPTVQRFLTLVKAGEVRVSYLNRQAPAKRYELAYGVQDKLTQPQVYRPKTRDLVAVHTAYHDNLGTAVHSVQASAQFAGRSFGIEWFTPVRAGQKRIEYFTPGAWVFAQQAGPGNVAYEVLHLRAGRRYDVAWNKAVSAPSLRGTNTTVPGDQPWAHRADNVIDVTLPLFGDSVGRPRLPVPHLGDRGSIGLYRNGELVGTVPSPDTAAFEVAEGSAAYRLVADAERAAHWWPLATKVSAEWTFRSSAADSGRPLPLLTVRFDPAVDLRNRAPGDTSFSFPAHVARQDAGTVKVTTLTVEVSYDDGRTWRPATVAATGDHWTVTVQHPTGGYASLRAKVTDADGSTAEQSVIRGYEIGDSRLDAEPR
ncbi:MAG TPA: S8 family serine peptidase [Candidatus Limnocylindrales bacterium]